jgi:hypothetical protein
MMCAYKRSHDDLYHADETDDNNTFKRRCKTSWSESEDNEDSLNECELSEYNRNNREDDRRVYEHSDDMEEEHLPNISEIQLNGLPFDGIYPRKPKFGRKIDALIDDIIRKSQRQTESQNSYALIPTPDINIWIPPSVGPHPRTDSSYLSRHPPLIHEEKGEHASPSSDTTTHADWFSAEQPDPPPDLPLPYGPLRGSGSRNRDESSSSDEYEDMAIIP